MTGIQLIIPGITGLLISNNVPLKKNQKNQKTQLKGPTKFLCHFPGNWCQFPTTTINGTKEVNLLDGTNAVVLTLYIVPIPAQLSSPVQPTLPQQSTSE